MIQKGNSKLANEDGPVFGISGWKRKRNETINVVDTTMRVTTPENISFQYEVTGPFHRLVAYIFDILISLGGYFLAIIMLALIFNLAIMTFLNWVGLNSVGTALEGIFGGMINVGYFVVYWFYGAYCETYFNGQTLGKRITGMRVISTDGHAIDGVQATLRNFFRLLDIMPLVSTAALLDLEPLSPGQMPDDVWDVLAINGMTLPTCLFGLIVMMCNKKFQRLGDLVAGTVVINESRKHKPELASFLDDRVPLLADAIPTSYVVPPSMARVVAEYVEQRKYLPYQRVSEIASYLARPLIENFGLGADTDHDLFLCALYYKTFVSAQAHEDAPMSMMIPMTKSDQNSPTVQAVPDPEQPIVVQPTPTPNVNQTGSNQAAMNPPAKDSDTFVLDKTDFRMDD